MALFNKILFRINLLINGSNNNYYYYYYYNTPLVYDFQRIVLDYQTVSAEYPKNFNLLRDGDQATLSSLKKDFGKPYFIKKNKNLIIYCFKVKSFGLKVKIQVGFKDNKIVCVYKKIYGKGIEMRELDSELRHKYEILGESAKFAYMNNQVFNCFFNKYLDEIEFIQIFNFDLMKSDLDQVIEKLESAKNLSRKKRNEFIKEIA
jgi:hypothetical protein